MKIRDEDIDEVFELLKALHDMAEPWGDKLDAICDRAEALIAKIESYQDRPK